MNYKMLFIFIEGDYDVLFFETICVPKLSKRYDYIKPVLYANEPTNPSKYIERFIRSLRGMEADYIFVQDINNARCVTELKSEIKTRIKNIDTNRILAVIKEIESWYKAGLDKASCRSLGIRYHSTTNNFVKEQLKGLMPKRFVSYKDFLVEILKYFSTAVAKQKNQSFHYFLKKYNG